MPSARRKFGPKNSAGWTCIGCQTFSASTMPKQSWYILLWSTSKICFQIRALILNEPQRPLAHVLSLCTRHSLNFSTMMPVRVPSLANAIVWILFGAILSSPTAWQIFEWCLSLNGYTIGCHSTSLKHGRPCRPCPRLALAGLGRPWPAMPGHAWPAMAGNGQSWPAMGVNIEDLTTFVACLRYACHNSG